MDTIQRISEVNFVEWIITAFLILSIIIAGYEIISKFLSIIGRPIGAIKQRKEDHELIIQNTKSIKELAERHDHDTKKSDEYDTKISKDLSVFMNEMRDEIKKITNNRLNDREQSKEVQKELAESIKTIVENDKTRDGQIDSLMIAQKEILAERINKKYKQYISLNGIPEDEVDEFVNLHSAYKLMGGNSSGDAKFEYCMNHLEVIPVETKLVIKHEK